MKISRSELYERVWQEPMKTLAAVFDISDVALRKICIKAEVPVPQRGYWAKLQAGKKVDKVSLSIRPPGMSETLYIKESRYGGTSLTEEELLGPIPHPPVFHESIEQVEARVVKTTGKVAFLKNFERPHPAIARLLKSDDERRAKQAASRYPSSWDDPLFDGPFEKRRLRILNSIFFGVTKFNGKSTTSGREARDVCITIHDVHVSISLDLPANVKKDLRYDRLVKGDPKSKMRLTINSSMSGNARFTWDDSDEDKIEHHIAEIVTKIVVAAEQQVRDQAHSHHTWWLQRRESILEQRRFAREEAERQRKEQLERDRQARIERLLHHSTELHQADLIRTLVDRAAASYPDQDREAFNEWAEWALTVANDLDPIRSGKLQICPDHSS